MNTLKQKDFDEYLRYAEKIESRITSILTRVHLEFGSTLYTWWFRGESNNGLRSHHLDPQRSVTSPCVTSPEPSEFIGDYLVLSSERQTEEWAIILDDGTTHELFEIPKRWLFEDFEEELVRGKKRLKNMEEAKKQEKIARKAEKAALKISAASKLTSDEKEALGLK